MVKVMKAPRYILLTCASLASVVLHVAASSQPQTLEPNPRHVEMLECLNRIWHHDPKNSDFQETQQFTSKWVLRETADINKFYKLEDGVIAEGRTQGHKTNDKNVVREATDLLGVKYAVKVIPKHGINVCDLRDEVRMMYLAQGHPNIVHLEEVFEDSNKLYIVMEHCDGGELFDVVVNSVNKNLENDSEYCGFTEKFMVCVLGQMMHALHFLHRRNIGHFDLKLMNVVFKSGDNNNKDFNTIKIVDFGYSKVIRDGQTTTQWEGTREYMAPELVCQDNCEYDKSADMWAIGVVTFAMLFGYKPFDSKVSGDYAEVIRLVNRGFENKFRLAPPGEFARGCFPAHLEYKVSEDCRDFITKCLTEDTKARLTADQAIKHPLLANTKSRKPIPRHRTDSKRRARQTKRIKIAAYKAQEKSSCCFM